MKRFQLPAGRNYGAAPSSSKPVAKRPFAPKQAAPAAPAGGRCGDWDCLYAKAGPKKRPTWIDGVVKREENGSQDRLTLIDVATGAIITRASVKVSTPTFEDDEEYETYFSKFKIQIQGRKGGGGGPAPAPAPAAPPRVRAPAPVVRKPAFAAPAPAPRAAPPAPRAAPAPAPRAAPPAPRPAPPRPAAPAPAPRAAAPPPRPPAPRPTAFAAPRPSAAPPPRKAAFAAPAPAPRAAAPPGEDEFEVVAEPRVAIRGPLARKLRPHQRDAAKFLYRALSGRQPRGGCGAILADEMGLGKTLATLTTLRLLVKAAGSCVNGDADVPKVRKAAVLCPASLVGQWPDEDAKFFGRVSSNVTWVACLETAGGALDGGTESAKTALERWRALDGRRSCAVLAISYESFQRYFASHIEGDLQLDLLVFDEGHRLKGGAGSKTARAIRDCRAKRRLLITGTPAMNDLSEFHALADVVNPDVFGPLAAFKRDVARPIEAGAVRGASEDKRLAATEAKDALRARAAAFYLRRTAADVSRASLPPKTVHVVCCRLRAGQAAAYAEAAAADVDALAKIQRLRALATRGADGDRAASGKLDVAFALLAHLRARPAKERAVLVSTSTVTLDACARECEARGWPAARLDGSTPAGERQGLVNAFNRPRSDAFVFLLSTRAGGCGLNLVGASRLLLLDPDWNPAADEQAMARVWRDGQKRPVHVYRLLGAGTVDEKIFMRQLGKHDVNDGVVDDAATAGRFTAAELADLFAYDPGVASTTYDAQRHAAATRAAWPRYDGPSSIGDSALRAAALDTSSVSYAKADTHAADGADRASGSTTSYGGPPDAGDSDDDDDAAAPARALRPCPACTFKNPAAAGVCEVCDEPLAPVEAAAPLEAAAPAKRDAGDDSDAAPARKRRKPAKREAPKREVAESDDDEESVGDGDDDDSEEEFVFDDDSEEEVVPKKKARGRRRAVVDDDEEEDSTQPQ